MIKIVFTQNRNFTNYVKLMVKKNLKFGKVTGFIIQISRLVHEQQINNVTEEFLIKKIFQTCIIFVNVPLPWQQTLAIWTKLPITGLMKLTPGKIVKILY